MRLLFLGVILFAMSFALGPMKNLSSAPNDVEQELKGLENEWLRSYLRGDKQTFDRIVADDFTRTDETGKFATKVEERALVQAPPASVNASLTNEDVQVRVYGDSAIVTGRIVSKVQGSLNFQSRFTDTFIKRGGRWQVVARHYSRVPTERIAINLDSKIYDAYIGQYDIAPAVVLDITKEGEKLMSQTTGQPKMELLPESEIEFFIKGFTAQFVFVRDGTGRVTKLIINQEGQRMTAKKLNVDGQVVSILLTPPIVSHGRRPAKNEMPMKAVEEALNELVPMAKRGEVCQDYGAFGSIYSWNRRIDYENVSIRSVTRGDIAAHHVLIEWVKCARKFRP